MKPLTILRVAYASLWAVSLLFATLYEENILEGGSFADDATMCYALGTVSVILTILLIPVSLRLFARVFKRLASLPEQESQRLQFRYELMRIALYYVIVLLNLAIYYATMESGAALCALMALVAYMFCVPKKIMRDAEA